VNPDTSLNTGVAAVSTLSPIAAAATLWCSDDDDDVRPSDDDDGGVDILIN